MFAQADLLKFRGRWLQVEHDFSQHESQLRIRRKHRAIAIALLALVTVTLLVFVDHAMTLAAPHRTDVQDCMRKLVGWIDRADKARPLHDADLDNTTLATSAFSFLPRVSFPPRRILPILAQQAKTLPDQSPGIKYSKPTIPAKYSSLPASPPYTFNAFDYPFNAAPASLSTHHFQPDLSSPLPMAETTEPSHHLPQRRDQAIHLPAIPTAETQVPTMAMGADITFHRTVRPAVPADTPGIRDLVDASIMANKALSQMQEYSKNLGLVEAQAMTDAYGSRASSRARVLVAEEEEDSEDHSGKGPTTRLVGALRVVMPAMVAAAVQDGAQGDPPAFEARLGMLAVTPELGYKGVGPMLLKAAEKLLEDATIDILASTRTTLLEASKPTLRIIAPVISEVRDLPTLSKCGYQPLPNGNGKQDFSDTANVIMKNTAADTVRSALFYKDVEVRMPLEAKVFAQTSSGSGASSIPIVALAGLFAFIGTILVTLRNRHGARSAASAEPLLATYTLAVV
jgi:hypothetical protein